MLQSPLSGPVNAGFGGGKSPKSKIIIGITLLAAIPFIMTTFAASVTVGNGNLEFGQGSQQAVACDPKIFIAMGEEWKGVPTQNDPSAGFFRVRTVTVSNLDLQSCAGKKLRVRLIDSSSKEIQIGPLAEAKVLQITIPTQAPVQNSSDAVSLGLGYLDALGAPVSTTMPATVALNISGTSVYDGSVLNLNNGDVTFFIDPSATTINIDGQTVLRTTVETMDNPSAQQQQQPQGVASPPPSPAP